MLNLDDILKQLTPLADPAYRDSIDRFTPQSPTPGGGVWTSIGVRAPVLREFEKPLFRQLKTVDDYHAMIAFTDQAFEWRIRELAVIGLEGLCKLKKHWNKDLLNNVRTWTPQLSGWETTDILGYLLLGQMNLHGVITIDDLLEYRDYSSVWGRRLLIVATILPLRKGYSDLDRYFEILSWYKDSREKMIVKAVSWALRNGTVSAPEKVRAFMDRYAGDLDSLIRREVGNKMKTGLKNPKK